MTKALYEDISKIIIESRMETDLRAMYTKDGKIDGRWFAKVCRYHLSDKQCAAVLSKLVQTATGRRNASMADGLDFCMKNDISVTDMLITLRAAPKRFHKLISVLLNLPFYGKENYTPELMLQDFNEDREHFMDEQFERFMNRKPVISESVQKALTEKAEKNALPVDILEEVYLRGCHSYSDKMVITMDQYAFGRVNNFVSGGKTRWTIDVDLWNEIHKRNR